MALYDGTPSIRLEGDAKRALALIPDAKALLYKTQAFLKTTEANTYSMGRPVGDDGYMFVLSANGVNIIHISVAPGAPDQVEPPEEEVEPIVVLDFYSGLVFRGYLEERSDADHDFNVCTGFAPTPNCASMQDIGMGRQESERLSVKPEYTFVELNNPSLTDSTVYSQYTKLRPSMYSGLMAKVVQVVMGLGRLSKSKLKRPSNAPFSFSHHAYSAEVVSTGVQIRFDYKFHRTHGITRAADDRLWLIEISNFRGVLARPLPVFFGSDTEAFYELARERGDTAMTAALDSLGCLPTGEAFPRSAERLNEMIEAGTVLRLLEATDLSTFYSNSPFSTALGWAFSPDGDEAHNTAYYYGDDGFQRSVWYQINIQIGELIVDRDRGDPIANASAVIVRVAEGPLAIINQGGLLRTYLPIKFFEPLVPGLVSHDAGARYAATADVPTCDTVMFVAFDGESLRTVKYYNLQTTTDILEIDDPRYPGECLYAGSWVVTERSGERRVPSMMYTSDFDDRTDTQAFKRVTTITSDDQGFLRPTFTDFPLCLQVCKVVRHRMFKNTVEVDTTSGAYLHAVVVIPEFSREGYYYATASAYEGGHTMTRNISYPVLQDPNVAYGWRYFPGAFPAASCLPFDCSFMACGGTTEIHFPGVTHPHAERRVVCLKYEPQLCSDFADSGPWISMCADIVSAAGSSPPTPPPSSSEDIDYGADAKASIKISSPGHGGYITHPMVFDDFVLLWQQPSPDGDGEFQQLSLTYSTIGHDCVVGYTNMLGFGAKIVTGYVPEQITANDPLPCFIGVNQP